MDVSILFEDLRALLRSNTIRALILAFIVNLLPATGAALVDQIIGVLDLMLVIVAGYFRTRADGPIGLRVAQWFAPKPPPSVDG